jgi:hypothetical protein
LKQKGKTDIRIDEAILVKSYVKQKEADKVQEFTYSDTKIVELERYGYAGNNWSNLNNNKSFKEKFGNQTRKTFSRYTTIGSRTWNITLIRKILESGTRSLGITAGSRGEESGRRGLW